MKRVLNICLKYKIIIKVSFKGIKIEKVYSAKQELKLKIRDSNSFKDNAFFKTNFDFTVNE